MSSTVPAALSRAAGWATANPGKTTVLGAGAVCIAAPMIVAAPLLSAVGFGANGIVAGMYSRMRIYSTPH